MLGILNPSSGIRSLSTHLIASDLWEPVFEQNFATHKDYRFTKISLQSSFQYSDSVYARGTFNSNERAIAFIQSISLRIQITFVCWLALLVLVEIIFLGFSQTICLRKFSKVEQWPFRQVFYQACLVIYDYQLFCEMTLLSLKRINDLYSLRSRSLLCEWIFYLHGYHRKRILKSY